MLRIFALQTCTVLLLMSCVLNNFYVINYIVLAKVYNHTIPQSMLPFSVNLRLFHKHGTCTGIYIAIIIPVIYFAWQSIPFLWFRRKLFRQLPNSSVFSSLRVIPFANHYNWHGRPIRLLHFYNSCIMCWPLKVLRLYCIGSFLFLRQTLLTDFPPSIARWCVNKPASARARN